MNIQWRMRNKKIQEPKVLCTIDREMQSEGGVEM